MKPLLTAQMSRDEGEITLYCPKLNIHTCGKTEQKVKRKFIDAIFEYWYFLQVHDFKNESLCNKHLPSLANWSSLGDLP